MLTPPAVRVVTTMAESYGSPDTGGLRIARSASVQDTADSVGLDVEFAPHPADEDEVVIHGGARVFLDAETAVYLTDKVLDGEIDDDGEVHFALGRQVVDEDGPQP